MLRRGDGLGNTTSNDVLLLYDSGDAAGLRKLHYRCRAGTKSLQSCLGDLQRVYDVISVPRWIYTLQPSRRQFCGVVFWALGLPRSAMPPPHMGAVGMFDIANILVVLALYLSIVYFASNAKAKERSRLPPGPKPWPIFRNILDLPTDSPWITYREWSRKFDSDIIYLDLPHQPTVILNTSQAILDLLEKRARLYADRPTIIIDELVGWEWNLGFMPYGPQWRATRRMFHQQFNQQAIKQYRSIQSREVRVYLKRVSAMSSGSDQLDKEVISQTFAAIILDIVYGMKIHDFSDEYVTLSVKAIESIVLGRIPGTFWVEYFPWLKYIPPWMPFSSARRFAEKYKYAVHATHHKAFDAVKRDVGCGIDGSSITHQIVHSLQNQPKGTEPCGQMEQIARDVTGIAYAGMFNIRIVFLLASESSSAAADTQFSAMSTFLLAMASSHSIQRRAQAELDSIVGPDRFPTIEDVNFMPFIQAILLEVTRWLPVTPLGVPHKNVVDDEYNGYIIPAGTTIIANVWAMLHDPVGYPNPEVFDPDRFMRDGAINPDVRNPVNAFGFGRRICPGRHLANETLLLMIASTLHVFNIEATQENISNGATTGVFSSAFSRKGVGAGRSMPFRLPLWVSYVAKYRQRRARLPPGPRPLPFFGNLFDMPKEKPWMKFVEWSNKYGSDILFVDIPQKPTIILNSYQAAYDLMEKRSGNYPDRPGLKMDELTGWDWALSLMPYGTRWREVRRAFHQYFNNDAVKAYRGTITREVRQLLLRESKKSGRIRMKSISRLFAAITLDVTYGLQIQDEDDEFISLANRAVEVVNENRTRVFWIEYFPWLAYIPAWIPSPYSYALAYARQRKEIVDRTRTEGFDLAAEAFAEGTASPSMTQKLLQRLEDRFAGTDDYERQKQVIIDATGMAYGAAVDTVSIISDLKDVLLTAHQQGSTASSFLVAMAMFPDVQKKAQEELDRVIGLNRLPTVEDIEGLPYIQAMCMEALRWMPVIPVTAPHSALEDDEYKGFYIPRGTGVVVNSWAILHDPEEYPEPERFNPDRFMLKEVLNPKVREPTAAWGYGRRICAGRHIAKETLSLMMASILHVFNVEAMLSEDERLTMNSTNTAVAYPESVPCRLKPRNAAALALINTAYREDVPPNLKLLEAVSGGGTLIVVNDELYLALAPPLRGHGHVGPMRANVRMIHPPHKILLVYSHMSCKFYLQSGRFHAATAAISGAGGGMQGQADRTSHWKDFQKGVALQMKTIVFPASSSRSLQYVCTTGVLPASLRHCPVRQVQTATCSSATGTDTDTYLWEPLQPTREEHIGKVPGMERQVRIFAPGSDIIFLDIPQRPTIVLNSYQATNDLMEKRSRNYSDRPYYRMDDLTGWDYALSLLPYGTRWRETRRAFHQYFNNDAVKEYRSTITREIRAFLARESQHTGRIDLKSISRTFAASTLDITYGMRIRDENNDFITLANKAVEVVNVTRMQLFWIEHFPWLTYIPSWIPSPYSSALAYARKHKETVVRARVEGFHLAAKAFAEGTTTPSMTQKLLQRLEDSHAGPETYAAQREIAIDATGIAYAGAVETQTATTSYFLLAVAMFPEVQKKAQQELDKVIGPDRLPSAEDLDELPYIQAVFMEALRWIPVVPINVPHRSLEDDEYNGFYIPAGTTVLVNSRAILHDPAEYPEPERFNPDRFMLDGALNPKVREPTVAFGSGRRICPGRHHAKEMLSLMMASILHVFSVEPMLNDDEKLTMSSTNAILTYPESVPCSLKPRNAAALALISTGSG
ncbi:hypothetical protein NM688_g3851 [Phlebia brevispora]|uniref:Uncharacterized protein n=1 Tax=Phlebia brevispora TaxID=194682 RepID=A0ACC1T4M2_9APHY|nr:hypothetical protein NM688_g3851 [Phlebia brevispora]